MHLRRKDFIHVFFILHKLDVFWSISKLSIKIKALDILHSSYTNYYTNFINLKLWSVFNLNSVFETFKINSVLFNIFYVLNNIKCIKWAFEILESFSNALARLNCNSKSYYTNLLNLKLCLSFSYKKLLFNKI